MPCAKHDVHCGEVPAHLVSQSRMRWRFGGSGRTGSPSGTGVCHCPVACRRCCRCSYVRWRGGSAGCSRIDRGLVVTIVRGARPTYVIGQWREQHSRPTPKAGFMAGDATFSMPLRVPDERGRPVLPAAKGVARNRSICTSTASCESRCTVLPILRWFWTQPAVAPYRTTPPELLALLH